MSKYFKLSNIFAFIQGNLREKVYGTKFQWLLRKHIVEQITWRIKVMNPQCYSEGSCVKCECDTPALQMANKVCEGNCYPKMMSKKDWETHKKLRENPLTPEECFPGKEGTSFKIILKKDYYE